MKLSVKTQYGIQAVFELAENAPAEQRISEIAAAQKIPARFLEQILLVLKKRGLVASSRGKHGGYALAKSPKQITVKDVVEAIEGPVQFTVRRLKRSPVIFDLLTELESKTDELMDKYSLDELLIMKREREGTIVYNI